MNQRLIRKAILFVLMLLQGIVPAMKLVALLFGWELRVLNGLLFAVPMAIIALATAVVCSKTKGNVEISGSESVCLNIALPLSLLSFLMLSVFQSVAMFIVSVVNCCGCFAAYMCCKGKGRLRHFAMIVTIILLVAVLGSAFLNIVFRNFGLTEIVRSVPSPDGIYTANVINIDQGALGGDSVVRVQRVRLFGIPLDDVVCLDRRVWLGDWGTTHLIGLYWMDDNTLMIEGEEHDFF